MTTKKQSRQRGVALLLALILLMVITAIAFGVIVMSNTENAINTNFKSEETEFFAARAGVEEARNRLLLPTSAFDQGGNNISLFYLNPPSTSNPLGAGSTIVMPTAALDEAQAGSKVLYILGCKTINPLNGTCQTQMTLNDVTTRYTSSGSLSPYFDDELCHDIPSTSSITVNHIAQNVPCNNTIAATYLTSTPSVSPYPLDYKWVRIMIKENGTGPYPVVNSQPLISVVCWDKTNSPAVEILTPSASSCDRAPAAFPFARPVYVVTSLAVSPSGTTRRMVQEELSLGVSLNQTHDWSIYGTSPACPAVTFSGNGKTGSFDSSTESTPTEPPTNESTSSGGDTGSNGGLSLGGNSSIGGLAEYAGTGGNCYQISGGNAGPANACAGNPPVPPCYKQTTTESFPVTPAPNPTPPQTNTTYSHSATLTPGNSYGNISVSGGSTVITLSVPSGQGTAANPAVFVMNSLTFSGQASMVISPPNAYVQIIIAGNGPNGVPLAVPLSLTGQAVDNTSGIPGTMVFDVTQPTGCSAAPCGTVNVAGGSGSYAVVNAPMDNASITGNGDIFGSIIGYQVNDAGNGTVWHDLNSANHSTPMYDAALYTIAFRELSY